MLWGVSTCECGCDVSRVFAAKQFSVLSPSPPWLCCCTAVLLYCCAAVLLWCSHPGFSTKTCLGMKATKVGVPPPKKVVLDLGASANVLTTNKDCSLMAVAGRKCE